MFEKAANIICSDRDQTYFQGLIFRYFRFIASFIPTSM